MLFTVPRLRSCEELLMNLSRYHWAFLLSPKSVSDAPHGTTRYHVTNKLQMRDGALKSTWEYEQLALPKLKTAKLLVKVLIGKVEKARKSFENCVKGVPLVQDVGSKPAILHNVK